MVETAVREELIGARPEPQTAARAFRYSPDFAPGVLCAFEFVVIVICGLFFFRNFEFYHEEYKEQYFFCMIFVATLYIFLSSWASLYDLNAIMRPLRHADNFIVSIITAFIFLLTIIFGFDVLYFFDLKWIVYFAISTIFALIMVRLAAFRILKMLSFRGIVGRNLVVLGVEAQSSRFLRKIRRDPPYFTSVAGVFTAGDGDTPSTVEDSPVLGSIDALLSFARRGLVDDVVVAMPWSDDARVITTIEKLKELPVNVYLGSDLVGFDLAFRPVLGSFSQLPVFEVVQRPISGWSSAVKVVFDYCFAFITLALLSPLLMLVAILIKLDSPGPVFFMQPRLGFNNKPFSIYKFRSMRHDADRDGVVRQATLGDPRVTRVGRIIRATSIDELPQLLNVLNGTMSVVGPRPHAISHNQEYGRQIRGYFARHKVRPGITGWAQVNGLRGETADVETMRRRVEHDVYYVENWSFLFDLKIVILTVFVVLFQKTAY